MRVTDTRSVVVVYDQTHVLGAPVARTKFSLNFANIDSVTIMPSGGTPWGSAGAHLAIDDLSWSLESNANGIDDDLEQMVVCWGANVNGQSAVPAVPADHGFVSTGFFSVGESCAGALAGTPPARPNQREGAPPHRQGHLAAADLNRDGWVDMRDIQLFMQGGASLGAD